MVLILLSLVFAFSPAQARETASRTPIEQERQAAEARLAAFDRGLSFSDLKQLRQTSPRDKERLSPRLRGPYEERNRLKEEAEYWETADRLKRDLLALPVAEGLSPGEGEAHQAEAETIARTAMQAFTELRQKYEMVRPAIFHNLLVNVGVKEEGLCWHWARDVRERLREIHLKTFDVQWATAREGTMREHNTVVLTGRGRPFREGIFLDGWKHAGRPYWMKVAEDKKHPWVPGACAVCGDPVGQASK